MSPAEPCRFLPWDSEFFGKRIARINATRLDGPDMKTVMAWSEENAIDCLYFLTESDDALAVRVAEDHSFRLQDIRMTYERPLDRTVFDAGPPIVFRLSRPEDLDMLRETARTAYVHSRFYNDPCFSEEHCATLYDTWLIRSFRENYADAVVVAELNGAAVAYITCQLIREKGEGEISLIGVTESARGQNIGQQLVYYALDWFLQEGMQSVAVVTQGRNVPAQRLYQRCGFVTRSVQLWYHKWLNNCLSSV